MSINKAFEKWVNKYVKENDNIDYDLIILEDMAEAWRASRIDLPKCGSCEYWQKWGAPKTGERRGSCISGDALLEGGVSENFGCVFHSELEKK